MLRTSLSFVAPGRVELREQKLPERHPGQVCIETEYSAISAGTEGLVYRGETPETLAVDDEVPTLFEDLSYPLAYGYATVGRVIAVGEGVDESWLDRRVFAYNPHETHFLADPSELVPVPETVPSRVASLHANAETAVNFLLDGQPAFGERVAVFGQGVVGLLTTGLLSQLPLDALVAIEPLTLRRELAREFGADLVLDPDGENVAGDIREAIPERPDLTYELSGNPEALNDAMGVTGFDGRILVGSWYGTKPATLQFGGRFHRHRLDIESSQVSTIAPRHEGRWSRERRHDVAWEWLQKLPVDSLLTHELPFERAPEAYELLETDPDEAVQVLLRYD